MDRSDVSFLRKMRFGELEPSLQQDIVEFAGRMGYESTITSSSNLHFLFKLYQAEKAKEKGSREALKKAEEIILRLVGLHHDAVVKAGGRRPPGRERRKPRLALLGERIPISRKTRDLLASIGITKGEDLEMVVGLLGEKKAQERADYILASKLGDELIKKIYGTHTELLVIANDDDFLFQLENMENKKEMIDALRRTSKVGLLPAEIDYNKRPDALLHDFKDILMIAGRAPQQLTVAMAPSGQTADEPRYVAKAMKVGDFISTIRELGFELVRRKKELVFNGPGGRVFTTSNPHDGEYDPVTVRRMITQMGSTPKEFEAARRKALGK